VRAALLALLLAGCVDDFRGPPIELPITDGVYSCEFERDGEVGYVELCWDREPEALADAIVAHEPRVAWARCAPTPIATCLYTCEPRASSCNSDGCYCAE
jgi:hypothetical protein